ncbi:MAG: homoaconitase [candidate division Zixibacteria bacterium]
MSGQNLVEKIAERYAVDASGVKSGDYLAIRPAHVMTHDNSGAVIPKFRSIGATKIHNRRQVVFTLDHNVQDRSEANTKKYAAIEAFASEQSVDFYPAGRGIGHQIMCEEGYAWPGTMVVASDSHSNMYGGLGCLGTPIVRTDAAAIWATGSTWWQVPPVAKVELNGKLPDGVTGKDLIITLCGKFNQDEVLNHAVEFTGDGIAHLSIDDRLTIANMTTEWGALVGLFPIDQITIDWLAKRAELLAIRPPAGVPSDADSKSGHSRISSERIETLSSEKLSSDPDCSYARELTVDLSTVVPHVSGPDHVKTMTPLAVIRKRKVKIQKAYLVSCVNSRLEDLASAATEIEGKRVADGVAFYIAAASAEVEKQAVELGYWQTIVNAGALVLPAGCGPCIGLGEGLLLDGEVGISATNRNFKGRMGAPSAKAYLASPRVVAASAVAGFIDLPDARPASELSATLAITTSPSSAAAVDILDGFPETITGELLFCPQDNLNTDGIFPGKYTYEDDFTHEQQAKVVMENYDPTFGRVVREGDILIGGFNFGTGSSREQAATALKYRGLQLVLAGSFSETYKRNAINNGFLAIEVAGLVNDLKRRFGGNILTIRTGLTARIDFRASKLEAGPKSYPIAPIGAAAQQLIIDGGLENWVKKKLATEK